MKTKRILFTILMMIFTYVGQSQSTIPKVEALLKEMTLSEKIGQLNLLTPGGDVVTGSVFSENIAEKIRAGEVGGIFNVNSAERIKQAQEIAIKNSRLKIPLLVGADIIHGYKTIFPIPLGAASSWDMKLIEQAAQVAAKESTADGINWNFSPMVDIARDPRWGRIAEGAGEDAYLGSAIAAATVRGYQGDDLSSAATMMACVKHLILYGAAEGGRDYNSVDMSRVKMYNQYLAPYKAAVDAGVGSAMTSFNDIDGVPASGNKWMITDLLRDQWGFEGFVTSDYTSINEMVNHGSGNLQAVSAQSLNAGLDMDMVGEGFLTTFKKSLQEDKITEAQITSACRRILEAKHKLGLFDDPYKYSDLTRAKTDILSDENRAIARKAASRSFVLLKKQENVLPLKKSAKIALVGPLADSRYNMPGMWAPTGDYNDAITILEGFKNVAPEASITYAKGSNISNDSILAENVNVFGPKIVIDKRAPEVLLEEAIVAANASDVVVAVVGEASEMTGEAASRSDISIPEPQQKLIRALVETGKPVVLVLMSGRPLTISEQYKLPVSILQVWHPGVEAGNAVADVIFGDYNPSGKLTATWPRNMGQIPIYHSMKNTGRPAFPVDKPDADGKFGKFRSNYLDSPNTPLIPFGYGLSYTEFEYSDLKVNASTISKNDSLSVSVTVKNTGDYDGEEVVQLYLRDVVRSITPPKRQLKGFQKVFIPKGASKTISLSLKPDDLKFYNSELKFIAEPGEFQIFVGTDSYADLTTSFELK